jgi:hypothetical protein
MKLQPSIPVGDDSEKYFGNSKTLLTLAHRKMVMKFVRDKYPQARFERIYDANTHGWEPYNFHDCCDKKGWTLTIVLTTDDFIFGGFTTAEWESPPDVDNIYKRDSHSFLFSVNEGSKYPITGRDRDAINCDSGYCPVFGRESCDLGISSDSNKNTNSGCFANQPCFNLPPAKGEGCEEYSSSINGGKVDFRSKEFEVFKVFVRIILI